MKLRQRKSILFGMAVLIAPASSASEIKNEFVTRAEYTSRVDEVFSQKDTDFDGYLSEEEIKNSRTELQKEKDRKKFRNMDVNQDQLLSLDEILQALILAQEKQRESWREMQENRFDQMDKDGNGHISRQEFIQSSPFGNDEAQNRFHSHFKLLAEKTFEKTRKNDINEDGIVTETEYVDKTDDQGRRKPKENSFTLRTGLGKTIKIPEQDANGDGRISRFEYESFYNSVFKGFDQNRDDQLGASELSMANRYLKNLLPFKSHLNSKSEK